MAMPDRSPSSLSRLFAPRSIAVVGASAQPAKAGYQMLKSLGGFPGRLYPINPKAEEILGHRAYPALAALPEPVDLAVLVIPAEAAIAAVREAGACSAGAAILVSGGFADLGAKGQALQDELVAAAREGDLRLLGPNTSGFIAPGRLVCATFAPGAEEIAAGDIAIVCQSGGVNIALSFLAHRERLGLSLAVGLGNAADVGAADVIEYLAGDPQTTAIALHLEGIDHGRRLFAAIRAASAVKPVVALPVGRTDIAAFARSHTGKLMGSYALTRAMLVQAGAVVVDSTGELIDAAHALARVRLRPIRRAGVGIVTGQAGPGLMMSDTLNAAQVSVPPLAEPTMVRIAALLPPLTYIQNPVDTGRPSASFGNVLAAVAGDRAIDALLVYALHEPEALDAPRVIGEARRTLAQPIVFGTGAAPAGAWQTMATLEAAGVPCFTAPDRAARAMRALVDDASGQARMTSEHPTRPQPARPLGPAPLDEAEAKALLAASGFTIPVHRVARTHAEAHAAFKALHHPVAVKALDRAILHKTEVGGVHLHIATEDVLTGALRQIDAIPGASQGRQYLIEEMAPPGVDLILGARHDPSFGPTVLVGLGGTAAEAFADVAMRLAPPSLADAEEMLDELQARRLLDDWRGAPRVDRLRLAQAIQALGRLIAGHPEIAEFDINPLRATADGRLLVLDALIVLGPRTPAIAAES